jgi:glutamate synthase (NADPH/NADH) small chain
MKMTSNSEIQKAKRKELWRETLRNAMPNKDRLLIERVKMSEVEPQKRITSQNIEVNLGLSPEQAVREASRCMDCANPTCIEGCPVSIDIPRFVKHIEKKEFLDAASTLKEFSALPAVCGRVCPQEKQCEIKCFYAEKMKKDPVAIGYLERFAADYERESGKIQIPEVAPKNGIKVAAIGSGPASLSFAGDMIKLGYEVTVFEALHEIGGVLKYGIPEFRLPNSVVDVELENLKDMGVRFEKNFIVGRTATFDDLKELGYKCFFIGSGAGLPNFMNIPGENLNGVMSSNEYLTRVNLMAANHPDSDTPVMLGKKVAVVGGGNTAMDSVRTAKRLGAERAMIIYRRSREEMPARVEEVKHAEEEGVEFHNLANPIEYLAGEGGRVAKVRLQRMKLGEPDASGRRRPVPVDGAIEELDIDLAIVAIGVSPNPLIPACLPDLKMSRWHTIEVDEETMQSSIPEFFAGGDIVRGGATVILAMGDGRRAAASMHSYLTEKHNEKESK